MIMVSFKELNIPISKCMSSDRIPDIQMNREIASSVQTPLSLEMTWRLAFSVLRRSGQWCKREEVSA